MQDLPSSPQRASASSVRWLLFAGAVLLGLSLLTAGQPPDRGEEDAVILVLLMFAAPGLLLAGLAIARGARGRNPGELGRVILPVLIPCGLALAILAVVAVIGRLPAEFVP